MAEIGTGFSRLVSDHPRPFRRSVLVAVVMTVVMSVIMLMAMSVPVMIMIAALCPFQARLVRVLLIQAMSLSVASSHPVQLCCCDLARRRFTAFGTGHRLGEVLQGAELLERPACFALVSINGHCMFLPAYSSRWLAHTATMGRPWSCVKSSRKGGGAAKAPPCSCSHLAQVSKARSLSAT